MTEHPSTAAILTLAFTVGTWVLNFVAAVQGGVWERLARYTPSEMLATFQHALFRLNLVLAAFALIAAALVLAAIWMRDQSTSLMTRWPFRLAMRGVFEKADSISLKDYTGSKERPLSPSSTGAK